MTSKREDLINELAYVVGKDRAEFMLLQVMAEDTQLRLNEMTSDGASFDALRDHLRTTDIGHSPRTWFLMANVISERDHRLAEKIRADQTPGSPYSPDGPFEMGFREGKKFAADSIDPKVA